MAERAMAAGRAMKEEDGVATAVGHIEELAARVLRGNLP
jgi:hypothetical protein